MRGSRGSGPDLLALTDQWQDLRKQYETEPGEVWVKYQKNILHSEGVWTLEQAPKGRGHSTTLTELKKHLDDTLRNMLSLSGCPVQSQGWTPPSLCIPSHSMHSMILWNVKFHLCRYYHCRVIAIHNIQLGFWWLHFLFSSNVFFQEKLWS